jgi:hypothetical protein
MRAAGQRSNNSAACTARQWLRGVVIITAAGFLLSCSSPLANLPDAAKLPDRTLNNNQQQTKINEMADKAQTHPSEAIKEIENQK